MEELKQRIKRYDNRIRQFHDNRNFYNNQGRFFKNREGKEQRIKPPNAEDAIVFWKGIWSAKVEHSGMQNELTKQKKICHLKNRINENH